MSSVGVCSWRVLVSLGLDCVYRMLMLRKEQVWCELVRVMRSRGEIDFISNQNVKWMRSARHAIGNQNVDCGFHSQF